MTAYFRGNNEFNQFQSTFDWSPNVTIYYLPGTIGWGSTLGGHPALLWNPLLQVNDADFGVATDRFGINITGTTNIPIVLEACTDLANPIWEPLMGCALTNGSVHFSDPAWTNYPSRLYRIRSP